MVCGFVQYFVELRKRSQLVFQTRSSQKLLLEWRAEMKGYSPNAPPPYPGDSPLTWILKHKYLKNLGTYLLIYRKSKGKKACCVLANTIREGSRTSISGLLQEHQYLFPKWLKGKSW